MKKIFLTISTVGVLLLLFSGCTKDPLNNLTDNESRIYITKHSDSANFGAYHTFSIADSVAVVKNNQLMGKTLTAVDAAYINAIKTEMESRGYTMVARDQNPDLGINVSRVYNTYTGVFNYGDYWNYYSGYWDPYYWGYPGYNYYFPPFYYGVYQIQEGALSVDIFDLMDVHSTNEITGIWNGLIRGTGVFNTDNADSGVKQLFDQSTYLTAD